MGYADDIDIIARESGHRNKLYQHHSVVGEQMSPRRMTVEKIKVCQTQPQAEDQQIPHCACAHIWGCVVDIVRRGENVGGIRETNIANVLWLGKT